MSAQYSVIGRKAAHRGWALTLVVEDGRSAKDLNRTVLLGVLCRLDSGRCDVFAVSKLDRLSRSVHDFSGLLRRTEKHGWSLVCINFGVDSTAAGALMANVVAATAGYERRLIGERTKAALVAKKSAEVRLGRPQTLFHQVMSRILAARTQGQILQGIADALTKEGVPNARGATTWRISSVGFMLRSQAAQLLSTPLT